MEAEDVSAEDIENELTAWLIEKDHRPRAEDGWITASSLCTKTGVSYDRANTLLNLGVADGELELWLYGRTNYYRKRKDGHILASGI